MSWWLTATDAVKELRAKLDGAIGQLEQYMDGQLKVTLSKDELLAMKQTLDRYTAAVDFEVGRLRECNEAGAKQHEQNVAEIDRLKADVEELGKINDELEWKIDHETDRDKLEARFSLEELSKMHGLLTDLHNAIQRELRNLSSKIAERDQQIKSLEAELGAAQRRLDDVDRNGEGGVI